MSLDPNSAAGKDTGVFGLSSGLEQSLVVYLAVPWEVTTSYGGGASYGPESILRASRQVDLFDSDILKPYEVGLHWLAPDSKVWEWNETGKKLATSLIEKGGLGLGPHEEASLQEINRLGTKLNAWVYEKSHSVMKDKFLGLVGGDHSVAFGAIKAVAQREEDFGILHFDAHLDMRRAYEGFIWSHASVLYNVLECIPEVKKVVSVGIRDYCEEEWNFVRSQGERVFVFLDREICHHRLAGKPFVRIAERMIEKLPGRVWVSFDIDGLDPRFCPNTGTPVPGGLDWSEATFILETLVRSGRKIVGFDLCEVAPEQQSRNEWDANVGARLLYKLTGWMLASQGKREIREWP